MTPARAWKHARRSGALLLLALMVAIVLPRFDAPGDLWITRAFYDINTLGKALSLYRKDHGELPSDAEGLGALARQGYLDHSPLDPWAHPYIYRRARTPKGYELYSSGLNGVDESGNGDDVTNPEKGYSCETYGINCPGDVAARCVAFTAIAAAAAGLFAFLAFGVIALYGKFRRLPEETGFPPARE